MVNIHSYVSLPEGSVLDLLTYAIGESMWKLDTPKMDINIIIFEYDQSSTEDMYQISFERKSMYYISHIFFCSLLRKMCIQWEQRSYWFVSHLIIVNCLLGSKWKDGYDMFQQKTSMGGIKMYQALLVLDLLGMMVVPESADPVPCFKMFCKWPVKDEFPWRFACLGCFQKPSGLSLGPNGHP